MRGSGDSTKIDVERSIDLGRFYEPRTSVHDVPNQSQGVGNIRPETREEAVDRRGAFQRSKTDMRLARVGDRPWATLVHTNPEHL